MKTEKKAVVRKSVKKSVNNTPDWMILEKFEMSFEHKIRLYRNLKLENTNSYCATPGTVLKFTKIKNEDNKIVFRVHRNGRRTFFTTSEHLQAPAEIAEA
jgi:DNA replicative helicase MCM subunit Mcm2 (Cdc46/Mcm family)